MAERGATVTVKRQPVRMQVTLTDDTKKIFIDGVDWSRNVEHIHIEQQGNREPYVTMTFKARVVGEIKSTVLK